MALIRTFRWIDNTVWNVQFVNDPNHLSDTDKRLMKQWGEPEIQMGGTFLEGDANEFTLPTKSARLRSDFPYTQEFDSASAPFDENTQTKVTAYEAEILTRIDDALETLRAHVDTFTGESTYNL